MSTYSGNHTISRVKNTSTSTSTRGVLVYAGPARAVGRAGNAGVRYSGAERRAMPLPRCHFPHVLSAVGGGRCWMDPVLPSFFEGQGERQGFRRCGASGGGGGGGDPVDPGPRGIPRGAGLSVPNGVGLSGCRMTTF